MTSPRHEMDRRSALKLIGAAAAGATVSPRMLATPAPSSKYPLVPVRSLYGAMRAASRRVRAEPGVPGAADDGHGLSRLRVLQRQGRRHRRPDRDRRGEHEAAHGHGRRVPLPAPRRGVRRLLDEPDDLALAPAQRGARRLHLARLRGSRHRDDPLHDGGVAGLGQSEAVPRPGGGRRLSGTAGPPSHRARDPVAALADAAPRTARGTTRPSPSSPSRSPSSGTRASARARSSPPPSPRGSRPSGPRAIPARSRPRPRTRGSCRWIRRTASTS